MFVCPSVSASCRLCHPLHALTRHLKIMRGLAPHLELSRRLEPAGEPYSGLSAHRALAGHDLEDVMVGSTAAVVLQLRRLFQPDDIAAGMAVAGASDRLGQKARCNVPLTAVIGGHRDRLAVVAGQHALDHVPSGRLEADPVAHLELQHLVMRPHLIEQAEPLDDATVQIDQLGSVSLSMLIVMMLPLPRIEVQGSL